MIQVESFPRVHVTLISMHAGGYRLNGGLGFAIDHPSFEVSAIESNEWRVVSHIRGLVNKASLQNIKTRLVEAAKLIGFQRPTEISICSSVASHTGLGSSTAYCLSSIEAAAAVNGINLSKEQLIALSGRGGTSGVGIQTYFDGGLTLDFGKRWAEDARFQSSDEEAARSAPLQIGRADMAAWPLAILIPSHIPTKSLAEEVAFFRSTCPLPKESTFEVLYHATMGTYSAAVEQNYDQFCWSLNAIQGCAWKTAEIALYGDAVLNCIDAIRSDGADAAGMSSLGPCVYFFANEPKKVYERCSRVNSAWRAIFAQRTNSGRKILNV